MRCASLTAPAPKIQMQKMPMQKMPMQKMQMQDYCARLTSG